MQCGVEAALNSLASIGIQLIYSGWEEYIMKILEFERVTSRLSEA